MPAHDQIELIGPSGEIKFYDLDPSKGITNIGRHPENDIVIDNAAVAPFHAVIDHRQRPYQLVVVTQDNPTSVGGEPVQPNVPHVLHTWDTIELDGHSLVLVEAGSALPPQPAAAAPASPRPAAEWPAAAAVTTAAAGATAVGAAVGAAASARRAAPAAPAAPALPGSFAVLTTPPPDRTDETIVTEITEREWIINVEEKSITQLTVVNGGDLVATFFVRVEGVDPAWVTVDPPQVNLFEGERAAVSIAITPPRSWDTSAGTRFVAITVSSPDYPNHLSSLSGSLTINPFYDFEITKLDRERVTVGWSKQTGTFHYAVHNTGNSRGTYRLSGSDDELGCVFQFTVPDHPGRMVGPVDLALTPNQVMGVPIFITPKQRRFFGVGRHQYLCTLTTTPLSGAQLPRPLLAYVYAAPFIGPWVIVLALIVLAVLIGVIFAPRIGYFGTDANMVALDPPAIKVDAGNSITLYWRTSPFFNRVRIDSSIPQDPDAGPVDGATSHKTFKPIDSVQYTLHAENFLTTLIPAWFSPPGPQEQVVVNGFLPGVIFTGTTTAGTIDPQTHTIVIVRGQTVTLLWTVVRSDALFLLTNDAPQSIPPEKYTGSQDVQPVADTTYKLQASNHYTKNGPFISDPIIVRVVDPTGTPPPDPVVERFDGQPTVITAGESVQLNWVVTGADSVSITGVDTPVLAPNGSLQVTPNTVGQVTYVLTAKNSIGKPANKSVNITVNPAPTATPVPLAPKIEFFTPNPATVVANATMPAIVSLSWSVTGHTTNIKISSPAIGDINNLDPSGTMTVSVTTPTLFVITALNGPDLSASQTAQITVNPPTPTPTPPPTSTPAPTPLPLPIIVFSAVSDPAHPELAGEVLQDTSANIPSTTRQYTVTAGTFVLFSWTATNAVKTNFNQQDKAPNDSSSLQILIPNTYQFKAFNAANAEVDLFIRVVVTTRQPPAPPFNVTGVMTQTTGPVTLGWQYSTAQLPRLDFFRVYRADVPSTSFAIVGDNISKAAPFHFVDTNGTSFCGKDYYVVGVFTDFDNVQKETNPSTNSWNSPACP